MCSSDRFEKVFEVAVALGCDAGITVDALQKGDQSTVVALLAKLMAYSMLVRPEHPTTSGRAGGGVPLLSSSVCAVSDFGGVFML